MSEATQCTYSIEKKMPGRRYVLSRKRCKNMTKDPSGKCYLHIWSR